MQTFLPYESFYESARVLDNKRLGKQRVEVLQILKAIHDDDYGWQNHPIVNMWRPYSNALVLYGDIICAYWISRGFRDTCRPKITAFYTDIFSTIKMPEWLGNESFHKSHRSNLLRKDFAYYSKHFTEPDNLPYLWYNPITKLWYSK